MSSVDARTPIAILASGAGTTAAQIMDASGHGLHAEVRLVVSNNSGSGALEQARARGVPTRHLSGRTHPEPEELDAAIARALHAAGAQLVVLAGYMKKLGPRVLTEWNGRIVNTHPSLLPAYGGAGMYGDRVHAAVLADGATATGASVHVVTAEYDECAVLEQRRVSVELDDDVASLRARVQTAEKELLVSWLVAFCSGAEAMPPN